MSRKSTRIVVIAILMLSALIYLMVLGSADGAEPGSESDPIVTLSFVDKKIEQIKYYIDSNLEEIDRLILELEKKDKELAAIKRTVEKSLTFEVVEMKAGQILLAEEGAEIIIRSGMTTAVYGELGGLSDITSAKDLKSGESIAINHMLIASRGDGRGVKAGGQVFLIIKGGYALQ